MSHLRLGIDPGYKNLGYALLEETSGEFKVLSAGTANPSQGPLEAFPEVLLASLALPPHLAFDSVSIERYVAYQGVMTGDSEHILNLIGILRAMAYVSYSTLPHLYRAIDWKTFLVKALFKRRGFRNPSESLDKKFSLAAAACILSPIGTPTKEAVANLSNLGVKNDHEADAVCIAAIPFYEDKAGTKTSGG